MSGIMTLIAGIDEVGRGSVAGPVVAGACVLSVPLFRRRGTYARWSPFQKIPYEDVLIADSKLLSPAQRECSSAWITAHCAYGIGMVDASVIDERGILFATNQAMLLALEDLRTKTDVDELLIDGRDRFRFPLPHRTIIRGDQSEPAIAAASIVAKVFRDQWMRKQAVLYPLFGFDGHKGYGSTEHMACIREHGPCPLHRRSFLRSILENQEPVLSMSA